MSTQVHENSASTLVTGSGGVIGRSALDYFASQELPVRGVSRRKPVGEHSWEHLAVDLLDAGAAREGLAAAADTTRVVFGAYIERLDPAEQIETNTVLLRNTLDALRDVGAPLRHVTLYQGHKFYGSHLGKFKVPAKESHARLIAPNFYHAQEDLLRERAAADGFELTIFRPEAVIGYAQGTPMNLLMAIATYVSITRELGIPLRFPGVHETYEQIFYQVSDAQLLAEATRWGGETPAAWGEAFNLTNGDIFHWREVFQAIAEHYGMPFEDPQPMVLAEHMPLYRDLWESMREKYSLVSGSYESVVDWRFGDMILNSTWDNVSSTIKVRKAGFGSCFDSTSRFIELLDDLVARKIIPPLAASR